MLQATQYPSWSITRDRQSEYLSSDGRSDDTTLDHSREYLLTYEAKDYVALQQKTA